VCWGADGSLSVPATGVSGFVESRERVLRDAPPITVVVCTRGRSVELERCLTSLVKLAYPRFSIVVVDNAPTSDRSKEVVQRFDRHQVRYVVEPAPGLSRARNRGLSVATTDVIAWIDDDEVADENWLAELARGFHEHPQAAAISGIMVPAELKTWPQVRFEQYGGHNKHRGFCPAVFSPASRGAQDPLYPLPPFGTGGNMAFRREALVRLGGFDVALGAGSPAMGSEDTKVFSQILSSGGTVVYQPTAVTYHFHRREQSELETQMIGYGVGLTAYYTSMVVAHPAVFWRMLRLIPNAYRDMVGHRSLRSGHLPPDFPLALRSANLRGLFLGPGRYLKERWRLRDDRGDETAHRDA
jgi:GT2 family glycosyltransferase